MDDAEYEARYPLRTPRYDEIPAAFELGDVDPDVVSVDGPWGSPNPAGVLSCAGCGLVSALAEWDAKAGAAMCGWCEPEPVEKPQLTDLRDLRFIGELGATWEQMRGAYQAGRSAIPPRPSRRRTAPGRTGSPTRGRLLEDFEDVSAVEYIPLLAPGTTVPARGGTIRCPLPGHPDRSPSFSVSATRGWACMGQCGVGGGIFQFAAAMNGITGPLRGQDFLDVYAVVHHAVYGVMP